MKGFKRKLAALILAAASAFAVGNAAYAEGSKDFHELVDGTTYLNENKSSIDETKNETKIEGIQPHRLYLEWRDRLQAGGMESKNVIYVYAKQGETVYFGSSVKSASDRSISAVAGKENDSYDFSEDVALSGATIAVTMPVSADSDKAVDPKGFTRDKFVSGQDINSGAYNDGKVYLFKPYESDSVYNGVIENRTQEVNGPNYGDKTGGYAPFSFTAPVEGTYSFRFLSREFTKTDLPEATVAPCPTIDPNATTATDLVNFSNVNISKTNDTIVPSNSLKNVTIKATNANSVNGYVESTGDVNFSADEYTFTKGVKFRYGTKYDNSGNIIGCGITLTPPSVPSKLKIYWSSLTAGNKIELKQAGAMLGSDIAERVGTLYSFEVPVFKALNYMDEGEDISVNISGDSGVCVYGIEYIYDTAYYTPSTTTSTVKSETISFDDKSINSTSTTNLVENSELFGNVTLYTAENKAWKTNQLTTAETADDKSFTSYLSTDGAAWNKLTDDTSKDDYTNPKRGIMSISPKHDGTLKIYWYNSQVKEIRIALYRAGAVLDNGASCKLSAKTAGVSTYNISVDETNPVIYLAPNSGGFSKIYAIEYSYTETTSTDEVIKPYPAVSEAETTAYAQPMAVPEMRTAVAGTVTYDFSSMTSIPTEIQGNNVKLSDVTHKVTDGNAIITKVVKLDISKKNTATIPTENYIMYTPKESGDIIVNAYQSSSANAKFRIVQHVNDEDVVLDTEYTAKNTIQTARTHVEKDIPVYIYSIAENQYYTKLTLEYDTATPTPTPDIPATQLDRGVNQPWADSPSLVAAWDVTVVDQSGAVQEGRAWADVLALNAGNHKRSVYANLYVLTKDGFEYQFNMNGIQPYGFAFYANNRGFLLDRFNEYTKTGKTDSLQTLSHSYFSYNKDDAVGAAPVYDEVDVNGNPVLDANKNTQRTSILPNFTPVDTTRDYNHKLFFNQVSDGNPVIAAYTSRTRPNNFKLVAEGNMPHTDVLDSIVPYYEGLGTEANWTQNINAVNTGTEGVGGNFRFTITPNESEREKTKGIYYMTQTEIDNVVGMQYNVTLDFSNYELNDSTREIQLVGAKHISGAKGKDGADYYFGADDSGNLINPYTADDIGTWRLCEYTKKDDGTISHGSGTYEKANKVHLSTVIHGYGDYVLTWDGKDNYGNIVPKGTYGNTLSKSIISAYLESGTVHFPIIDVERAPYGVKTKLLNKVTLTSEENRDKIYYNNDAEPKTALSGKYFTGRTNNDYPGQIADGQNNIDGKKTYFDDSKFPGALVMENYKTLYFKNDPTKKLISDDSDTTNVMVGIEESRRAYGNYCAIDLSSRYSVPVENGYMGIKVASPKTAVSKPIVSFVANDAGVLETNAMKNTVIGAKVTKDAEGNETSREDITAAQYLGDTHVYDTETGVREDMPEKKGNDVLGNTISTGFEVNLKVENPTEYVMWEIEVPLDNEEKPSLFKHKEDNPTQLGAGEIQEMQVSLKDWLGESAFNETVSLGAEDDIEDLGALSGDELTYVGLDSIEGKTTVQDGAVKGSAIISDNTNINYNRGTIYKFTGFKDNLNPTKEFNSITFRISYKLPVQISGGATISHGLVIDNLYAPDATAIATFMGNNTEETDVNKFDYTTTTDKGGIVIVGIDSKDDLTEAQKNELLEKYKQHENNEYKDAFKSTTP